MKTITNRSILKTSIKAVLTGCGLLALSVGTADAATKLTGTVSGKAYSVFVNVNVLNLLKNINVGPLPLAVLPPSGGFVSKELLSLNIPGILKGPVLYNATTGGVGAQKASSASLSTVTDLDVLNGLIHADVLTSACTSWGNGVSAKSQGDFDLINLKIGNKVIDKSLIKPNTKINLVNGLLNLATITLFEQTKSGNGVQTSNIVNNALHVKLNALNLLKGDIVVSSAQCGVNAKLVSEPPKPTGSIWGTGFFQCPINKCTGTVFATFNFKASASGAKIEYKDIDAGVELKSTGFTSFNRDSAHCATFKGVGDVVVNGVKKTGVKYITKACDFGDPGVNKDYLIMKIGSGYTRAGFLQGGNITADL